MNELLESLKWRYATKKFDASKKVSNADINYLKQAMQLTASSYGLQPYVIYVIEDLDIRKQLREASYNQAQITDASHLIVLANRVEFGDEIVDKYIYQTHIDRNRSLESMETYSNAMKNTLSGKTTTEKQHWTALQTYIVLGNLLTAAAYKKIDACPLEGFQAEKYNQILKLSEKGLNAAVIATVGYRAEDDKTQFQEKVRTPFNTLYVTL